MQPIQQLKKLCEQFSIDILYVFGSRSQEAARFVWEEPPCRIAPATWISAFSQPAR